MDDSHYMEDTLSSFAAESFSIFDSFLEGCQIIGPDFKYLYINDVAARQGKFPKEHFTGRRMVEVYPGIKNTPMFSVLRECMTDKASRWIDNEFTFPDGSTGCFELRFTPIPQGILILSVDITEQIKAAEALKESQEKLHLFVEHAPVPLAMFDRDMRYLNTSRRWRQWLSDDKLEARDLIGLSHYEVFPGVGVAEKYKAAHRRALAGEVVREDADRMERSDGSVRWARWEARPWFDREGSIGGIIIINEDITEKMLSEEALRESEERHRTILQTAQDGFLLNDKKGRILEVNDAYCRMSGYSEAELLELHISDIEASESGEEIRQKLKQLKSLGQLCFESTHKRKDGSTFDVEVSVQYQPLGKADYVAFIRDITTRKQIEKERRINFEVLQLINESESWDVLLKSVLGRLKEWSGCEAVGIRIREEEDYPYFVTSGFSDDFVRLENSLCTYDMNGAVTCDSEGNPVLECMCGNVIEGRYDPSKTFFTTDGCFWSSCTTELLATTTDADRQARTRNRCNAVGYESVALIPLRSGNETFGLIQLNDRRKGRFTPEMIALFTRVANHIASFIAKKHTEISLQKSEEKFRLVTESINDVVWMSTRGVKKMIYASKAYETIWGRSLESLYQSPASFMDAVHPDDLNIIKNAIDRFHAKGLPYECEYRIINENGDIRWIIERGFPVSESYDGEMVMAGVCVDITERIRAQNEKKQMEKQFVQAQKLETIGRLAGGVAHDYNNLLMVQLGYCELIESRLNDEDPLLENIHQIKDCALRASDLTKQLLAFSRKQKLLPKVLDLNGVIKKNKKMLGRLIGEDITVSLSLDDNLWRMKADPGQIEQVIMNLAVNSRDAMPHGGKLMIETANVFLDETYAFGHEGATPGPFAMLAISDTGFGMDEETKTKLFEPFFTTKGKEKGTGLGLATVYGIVKQSGGDIYVYSEPGKGATFKIYFPRVEDKLTAPAERKGEAVSGKGELILLVEDEPQLRKLFEHMIKELGYRVAAAANGDEALVMVDEDGLTPDLVITDVVMPGMNGKALVERLNRLQPDSLKAVYVSGYTDETIIQHGLTDSGTLFLEKPFSKIDLAGMIRKALH